MLKNSYSYRFVFIVVIVFFVIFVQGYYTNLALSSEITTSGTLTSDETWSGEVELTGDVTVPEPYTLRIEPGTVVKLDEYVNLNVEHSLFMEGTASKPIIFKRLNATQSWGDLNLFSATSNSTVSYSRIQGGSHGIIISESNASIRNNVIKNSYQTGIYITKSSPKIWNNIIFGIENDGIRVLDSSPDIQYNTIDSCYFGISMPSHLENTILKNNIITHNHISISKETNVNIDSGHNNIWHNKSSGPLLGARDIAQDPLYSDYMAGNFKLQSNSTCKSAGSNGGEIGAFGNNQVLPSTDIGFSTNPTTSGKLKRNEKWSGTIELSEDVIVPEPYTLRIEPGTVLKLGKEVSLRASHLLYMQGSPANPIVVKRLNESEQWHCLSLDDLKPGSVVTNSIIQGGASGINLHNTSAHVKNCTVKNCWRGILVQGSQHPIIKNNKIFNIYNNGIESLNSAPNIQYNTIHSCNGNGLKFEYSDPYSIVQNNIITNNNNNGISGNSDSDFIQGFNDIWANGSGDTISSTGISADPLYMDETNNDFRLQSSSLCKNASIHGTEIGAYSSDVIKSIYSKIRISSKNIVNSTIEYSLSAYSPNMVDKMRLRIYDPDGNRIGDVNYYIKGPSAVRNGSFATTGWEPGEYTYIYWVNDLSGNSFESTPKTFILKENDFFTDLANSLDGRTISGDMALQGSYAAQKPVTQESPRFKWVILKDTTEGAIAKAQIAPYGVYDFTLSNLLWMDMDSSQPLKNWTDLLESGTHELKLLFGSVNGGSVTTEPFTVTVSDAFTASIQASRSLPVIDGANSTVQFSVQNIQGGEPPYTYEWTHSKLFLDGMGEVTLGTSEQVSATPENWNLAAAPLVLTVTDSQGKVAYARKLVTVVDNYERGNPAVSGSGSTLVRGVDVAQGNYHLEKTDLAVSSKGPDFVLSRSYNSKAGPWAERGWQFNYQAEARYPSHTGYWKIDVKRADGRVQEFFLGSLEDDGWKWYPAKPGSFELLKRNDDASLTLYTKGARVFHFASPDSKGYCPLVSISDRDGHSLDIDRDSSGQIQTVRDAVGRDYTFEYGENGRVTSVTDFTGRSVSYAYDSQDRLVTFQDVDGEEQKYQYKTDSKKALLVGIVDFRGNLVQQISYDDLDRVQQIIGPLGNKVKYRFAKDGTAVEMPVAKESMGFCVDQLGRVTQTVDAVNYSDWVQSGGCETDNSGLSYISTFKNALNASRIAEYALQSKSVDPLKRDTEYGYADNGTGDLSRITDAKDRSTSMGYASSGPTRQSLVNKIDVPGGKSGEDYGFSYQDTGHIKELRDPLRHSTAFDYTQDGQVQKVTAPEGNWVKYEYTDEGYPKKVTDPYGQSIKYTYDDLGRVKTVTDKKGYTTEYVYNVDGNVKKVTDPFGHSTVYDYDANGNVLRVTDPRGNTVEYAYNKANKLKRVTYSVNGNTYSRIYAYDQMSRLQAVTNEKGNTFTKDYGFSGGDVHRIMERVNPLSEEVRYEYTKTGKVKSITDDLGHSVTYYYDQLDRVKKVENDLGHYAQYTYNLSGLVESYRDKSGEYTYYAYNDAGQLIGVKDASEEVTNATYDKNGNLDTVTDPEGHSTDLDYDQLDRLVRMEDARGRVWEYEYDANNNLVKAILPGGKVIEKEYDALNRVTDIHFPDGRSVSYTYDENGNRKSMTDSVGITEYIYDDLNRLMAVHGPYGKSVGYKYDPVGNVEELYYPDEKKISYEYDAAERMKKVIDWLGKTTEYKYKSNGLLREIVYGNGASVHRQFDEANRMDNLINRAADGNIISSHDMILDKMGYIKSSEDNLPLSPPMPNMNGEMTYDESNRLKSIAGHDVGHDLQGRITSSILKGRDVSYTFNSQDLITKVASGGEVLAEYKYNGDGQRIAKIQNGKETRYVLDVKRSPYSVLAEMDGDNDIRRCYVYGANGLLSQITPDGESHYYHFDPSGNTMALSDEDGHMSDAYAYTPYGVARSRGDTYNPFKFVGKYGVMDDGNGLNYMRARYYDPGLKRFLSIDPVKGKVQNPQSLNQYAYVQGDPVNMVDPRGKFQEGHVASMPSETSEVGETSSYEHKDAYGFCYNSKHQGKNIIGHFMVSLVKNEYNLMIQEPANKVAEACSAKYVGEPKWSQASRCLFKGVMVEGGGGGLDVVNPFQHAKAVGGAFKMGPQFNDYMNTLSVLASTRNFLKSIRKSKDIILKANKQKIKAKKTLNKIAESSKYWKNGLEKIYSNKLKEADWKIYNRWIDASLRGSDLFQGKYRSSNN